MKNIKYPDPLKFHIAISLSDDSSTVAGDIYNLLNECGLKVYFYKESPDLTGGVLENKIKAIYEQSDINCMIWTKSYANKTMDAIVTTEINTMYERHIIKNETDTLFIIKNDLNPNDDIPISSKFNKITYHSLKNIGIFGTRNLLIDRLFESFNYYDTNEERLIYHPKRDSNNRGSISLCKFKIDPDYNADKGWERLHDIKVKITHTDKALKPENKVYLIPSGRVSPLLAHAKILAVNPMSKKYKKQFSKEFVSQYMDKELVGYLFYIFTDDIEYPFIYNIQYDEILCKMLFNKKIL